MRAPIENAAVISVNPGWTADEIAERVASMRKALGPDATFVAEGGHWFTVAGDEFAKVGSREMEGWVLRQGELPRAVDLRTDETTSREAARATPPEIQTDAAADAAEQMAASAEPASAPVAKKAAARKAAPAKNAVAKKAAAKKSTAKKSAARKAAPTKE